MTASPPGSAPVRLAADELRGLFLFEDLDPDQLAWVSANGDVVDCAAGTEVTVEGEPAECFFVLLDGTMTMFRRVGGSEVETVRTDARGVYSGAVQFYFEDGMEPRYPATVRAVTDCRFFTLPAGPFAAVSASGTRWRCTCWRGCSSGSATPRSWSASGSGCWPWAS